jgi:hypothetical protein
MCPGSCFPMLSKSAFEEQATANQLLIMQVEADQQVG